MNKMTPINKDTLLDNGFNITDSNGDMLIMSREIINWNISYSTYDKKTYHLTIEADGYHDCNGSFDISHFKHIEQIDNLINAMLGL